MKKCVHQISNCIIVLSFSDFQYTIMMEFQRLSQNQDRILSLLQNSNMDTEESDDTGDQILVASSSMEEFKKEELELKQSSKKRKIKVRLRLVIPTLFLMRIIWSIHLDFLASTARTRRLLVFENIFSCQLQGLSFCWYIDSLILVHISLEVLTRYNFQPKLTCLLNVVYQAP